MRSVKKMLKGMLQKPKGKRSIAVAVNGHGKHQCYGDRISYCHVRGKAVKKRSS